MSTLDILMGVVYKLNQEIIDFIIDRKRADASLSCRKLVEVVRQQHDIELSKSSVNAIIREFNLSSPVGRKPTFKAPKNFFIPQDRKKAIREQLKPFLTDISGQPGSVSEHSETFFAETVMDASQAIPDPGSDRPQTGQVAPLTEPVPLCSVPPASVPETGARTEFPRENDQALTLLPDPLAAARPLQDDAREVERTVGQRPHFRRIWGIDDGPLLDGVGGIFLLALLWELDREGSLGKLISDACGIASGSAAARAAEGVLILDAFGAGILADDQVTVPSGIAAILGLSEVDATALFSDIFHRKVADARLRMAAGSAFAAASFDVACLEFTTDKGEKFYTDPLMEAFLSEPDLARSREPLLFVLERLADRCVNNVEPCLFDLYPGHSLSDPLVWERLATMSGQTDDPVLSVAVLSARGERVAGFERIPNIQRKFVAIGPLTDADMRLMSFETIQDGQEVFEPVLELEGSLVEGRIAAEDNRTYRGVVFSDKAQKQKFLIAHNSSLTGNMLDNCIRRTFMSNPPNCINRSLSAINEPQLALSVDISGTVKPLYSLSQECFEYLEKRLFDRYQGLFSDNQTRDFINILYKLKGYVKKHPTGLLVKLVIPPDHPQPEAVFRAAAALNLRSIKDRLGDQVIVC